MATLNHAAIDRTIRKHWSKLRKKGVLAVRPGYTFTGGWITDQPAAVAIVDKKKKHLPPKDLLPHHIGDVPVDVQEAGPFERMRHTEPARYARVTHERQEYNVPAAPFERTMNSKGAPPSPVPQHAAAPKSHSKSTKAPVHYSAPVPAPSLGAVTRRMTITCHASPDAGWLELQPFLSNVKKSLTVGLYDFTSEHILKAFLAGMSGRQALTMVLDHPSANQTADQSDEQTRADILNALKARATFAWALDAMDPLVSAKIFPTAYHIKVAVRDSDTFWLSSGNWNNSNQPDINPTASAAAAAAAAAIAKKSDRDWHVIVEDAGLAGVFEAFLKHDNAVAAPKYQLASPVPPTPLPSKKTARTVESGLDMKVPQTAPSQYFKPQTITDTMTITPLLTPDNYGKNMLPLIQSAKKSIYIQTQYIHLPKKQGPSDLMTLLAAVRDKMNAGVDVRIILSEWENAASLDAIKSFGINTSLVKLQNGVHNKGFVIDSSIVALGSQNWSVQGAEENRDASLIIKHEGAAQYYEQIFMHDWTKMAVQHLNTG
jgi:phosphatidylserine/phosphatidylglycerophosphate/cardiolipin synthase-like enzyme